MRYMQKICKNRFFDLTISVVAAMLREVGFETSFRMSKLRFIQVYYLFYKWKNSIINTFTQSFGNYDHKWTSESVKQ